MENQRAFLETNTRDGGFFQSEEWRLFQESSGRQTTHVESEGLFGNGIFHTLSLIGQYVYFPRGPLFTLDEKKIRDTAWKELLHFGRENKVAWIRVEPQSEDIKEGLFQRAEENKRKIVKAPRDTQPSEIFMIDISGSEEEVLSRMKQKTRYNIRLAEKKGVKVFITKEEKYTRAFLDLIVATSERKVIAPHPRVYYEKFFSAFTEGMLFLFVAEYKEKVIAANMVAIYGKTAYYLHGGSSDEHRDAMAPYLLQWEQIKFAKEKGATRYDFGGIQTRFKNSWEGITKFKLGFSPKTEPTHFPGTYDIVIDKKAYFLYRILQTALKIFRAIKRFAS